MNKKRFIIFGFSVIAAGFIFGFIIQKVTTKDTDAGFPVDLKEADAMFEKTDVLSEYSENEMIRTKAIAEETSGKEMVFAKSGYDYYAAKKQYFYYFESAGLLYGVIENTDYVSKIIVSDKAFESNDYEKITETDTAEYLKRYIRFNETEREDKGCLITYYEKKGENRTGSKVIFHMESGYMYCAVFFRAEPETGKDIERASDYDREFLYAIAKAGIKNKYEVNGNTVKDYSDAKASKIEVITAYDRVYYSVNITATYNGDIEAEFYVSIDPDTMTVTEIASTLCF